MKFQVFHDIPNNVWLYNPFGRLNPSFLDKPEDLFWELGQTIPLFQSMVWEFRPKLPSGKLTQLWKITIFNGKTHYFYGHFQ